MPRYFFDTLGKVHTFDEDGEILANDDDARSTATAIMSELAAHRVADIWSGRSLGVLVRNDRREPIGVVHMTAVPFDGRGEPETS